MSSSSYDWNDLKYFLACARRGSLAKAGRDLKVDQTTVSRRLTALEEAIGARLFDRTAPRTVLTPAGAELLETAQQIEHGALEFDRIASGADERFEGVVRVATSETLSVAFLARQLVRLHEAHPGIELELVTGAGSLNLLKREADLALRAGVRPRQSSLVARKIGRHSFHLYASEAYRNGPRRSTRRARADRILRRPRADPSRQMARAARAGRARCPAHEQSAVCGRGRALGLGRRRASRVPREASRARPPPRRGDRVLGVLADRPPGLAARQPRPRGDRAPRRRDELGSE